MSSLRSRILHRTLQRVTSALDVRLSIQEQRTRLDEMARRGIRLPKGVTVRTVQAGGVHAEWIEPAAASPQTVILYLHGGGYCLCSLDSHRGLAARLALAGGSPLLLLDYRLAPEHPFPAALEDALTAYRWLPVLAAARLSENIPELEGWLVKQVQRRLRENSQACYNGSLLATIMIAEFLILRRP